MCVSISIYRISMENKHSIQLYILINDDQPEQPESKATWNAESGSLIDVADNLQRTHYNVWVHNSWQQSCSDSAAFIHYKSKENKREAVKINIHLFLLHQKPPAALYQRHFNSSHIDGPFRLNGQYSPGAGMGEQTSLPFKDGVAIYTCFSSFTPNLMHCMKRTLKEQSLTS